MSGDHTLSGVSGYHTCLLEHEERTNLIWRDVWVSHIISTFEQNPSLWWRGSTLLSLKTKSKGQRERVPPYALLDVVLNDDTCLTGSIIRPTRFNGHDSAFLLFGRWFGHLLCPTSILICPALCMSVCVCVFVSVCLFIYCSSHHSTFKQHHYPNYSSSSSTA